MTHISNTGSQVTSSIHGVVLITPLVPPSGTVEAASTSDMVQVFSETQLSPTSLRSFNYDVGSSVPFAPALTFFNRCVNIKLEATITLPRHLKFTNNSTNILVIILGEQELTDIPLQFNESVLIQMSANGEFNTIENMSILVVPLNVIGPVYVVPPIIQLGDARPPFLPITAG